MKLRKAKGFTLIELVIVIVIVGILAAVSVPIYRGYTRKAMASEAMALAASVASAEKIYYAEHSAYAAVTNAQATAGGTAAIPVDPRGNKYFTSYAVTTAAGPTFTVTTSGTGDASGITFTYTGTPTSVTTSITL